MKVLTYIWIILCWVMGLYQFSLIKDENIIHLSQGALCMFVAILLSLQMDIKRNTKLR